MPCSTLLATRDYDLAATLNSGQVFRWAACGEAWEGVVGGRWTRLRATDAGIVAETAGPSGSWQWLEDYLQVQVELDGILRSFPDDAPMRTSVAACRGLRVLRQEPWECLASFILSSTKRIIQIRQIIDLLCRRYGSPVPVPRGHAAVHAFPTAEQLAQADEAGLRACKMGFRAPHLLGTARLVAEGAVRLEPLRDLPLGAARERLMQLPGVGHKIADCVLLFAYGFPQAFPVDVWVRKALRELYFPRRRPAAARLRRFIATYFGPHAGYAQQYLFHYMRTRGRPALALNFVELSDVNTSTSTGGPR